MKPAVKIAIVAGGYLLAFVLASAAVALHAAMTSDLGARASGGMSAFGDLMLFIAVFGAVALVPTGAAFFFLLSKKKGPKQSSESTLSPGTSGARHEPRNS
jgi:hypothetical protein